MAVLNFALGETIDMLKDAIWQFAQGEIAPLAADIDREHYFPRQLWPKLGKLGILGMTVEEEYGGSGLGYLEHVIAMEEISRASASVGLSYGAHSNLCVNQIRLNANEQQKKRYLPPLCAGTKVGALAMSETQAGSDVMNMQLRAEKKANHFILNGTKMWITNGPEADIFVVYARTNLTDLGHGLSAFIIEKDTPGFYCAQPLEKLGMCGSPTCELVFENCEISTEQVLGEENQGTKVLMRGLDYERVVLAGGPVGIMQACFDLVMPYIRERKQFGRAIGEFELIQAKVADMYTALMTSRAYLYTVAKACDRGEVTRQDAASAILYAAEKATWMAQETIQCLGGNGYINDYPAGRLWRDAKLYEIGAGTSEIRRILIGRELFKDS
jgi:isovaleryl-CoA dehydrogenase